MKLLFLFKTSVSNLMKEFFVPFLAVTCILISSVLELNQLILLWLLCNRCLGGECVCERSELCEHRRALSLQQESVTGSAVLLLQHPVTQFLQEGVQHELKQLWDICYQWWCLKTVQEPKCCYSDFEHKFVFYYSGLPALCTFGFSSW